MLKVAIDKNPLVSGHKIRGVGRYTTELISSLSKASFGKILFKAVEINRNTLDKYDVVHLPFFNPLVSKLPDINLSRVVVTIHDLVPMIYPDIYQAGIFGRLNILKQKRLLGRIGAVIVPSETSKKDVVRLLGIDPSKIKVVYEAHKSTFKKVSDKDLLAKIANRYRLPEKFVLYVGDVNYNKNIPTLIEACSLAGVTLVICGKQALDLDDYGISLMNMKGPRDWVRFLFNKPHPEVSHHGVLEEQFRKNKNIKRLGFVADSDLVAIYNLASVYVQPSFYEGFGLSVLEAMASGTPVVVSKTNALVEVSGNAALVADPFDPKDFAKKIKSLITKRKVKNLFVKNGLLRASGFSWAKAAKESIKVYKTIVNS